MGSGLIFDTGNILSAEVQIEGVENVYKQGIKSTLKSTNAPAELQDIAVKLAALAQQIKSIAAAPLGEAVAEHAEVPPSVAIEQRGNAFS